MEWNVRILSSKAPYCIQVFQFGFANEKCFHQSVTLDLNSPDIADHIFSISKTEKKTTDFLTTTITENSDPDIQNCLCKYFIIEDFYFEKFDGNQYFSIFQLIQCTSISQK